MGSDEHIVCWELLGNEPGVRQNGHAQGQGEPGDRVAVGAKPAHVARMPEVEVGD